MKCFCRWQSFSNSYHGEFVHLLKHILYAHITHRETPSEIRRFTLREKLFKRTVLFRYIHCWVNYLWRDKNWRFLNLANSFFAACWLADKWYLIPYKFWFFTTKQYKKGPGRFRKILERRKLV